MAPPVRPRHRGEPRRPVPDLVLAGRALVGGRLQPLEVGVDGDGRIVDVGRSLSGDRRHDVGERVLLPSATDVHVHFREPGPSTDAETIASGTVGAALGGVGLVGEMPNTDPPVRTVDLLEAKSALVRGRAAVDVLLYAVPSSGAALQNLARRAGGFKLYLSPTTGIDTVPSGADLTDRLRELADVDLPLVVHAEDPALFRTGPPPVDLSGWDAARPVGAEAAAVRSALGAPERLRLHIAHVTTPALAREVVRRGASCEVSAHHLLLSTAAARGAEGKVNPPLRSEKERTALWAAYRDGTIPILASDHAPHGRPSKALPFGLAPSGAPGVQTTVPLLLAKVASGELPLEVLVRTACDRPARLLGQPVGRLSVGHRANLLVVDFRARRRIRGEQLRSPCGWSPFEGAEAVFPQEHWRDGERIVDGGEYVGRPNGSVVRPEYAPGEPRGRPSSA